jgi:outer membrane murein-binding lipoprotein Lpp
VPLSSEPEDKRAAANTTATLSHHMTTASLVLLAINAGLITFVYDKREPTLFFTLPAILVFVCFVASAFCGAWGVDRLATRVSEGNWNKVFLSKWDRKENTFWLRGQTLLAGVGLICFSFALSALVISGDSNQDLEEKVSKLSTSVQEQQVAIDKLTSRVDAMESETHSSTVALRSLQEEAAKLRKTLESDKQSGP